MPDLVLLHHEAHRKSIEYLVTIRKVKGQWQERPEPHQVTTTAFVFVGNEFNRWLKRANGSQEQIEINA
jgi:hypothetical protein